MSKLTGFTRDTGFQHVGLASTLDARQSGIFLPLGGAGGGGEYGELITDDARAFAITREPIAYRVVFSVAFDAFNKWFNLTVKGKKDEESAQFDQKIQAVLSQLHAKRELTKALAFRRAFGWSILAVGVIDDAELNEPLSANPSDIIQLKAYSPLRVQSVDIDKKVEKEDGTPNPHFGYPEFFNIKRKGAVSALKIHYTRTLLFQGNSTGQESEDWQGTSVLDTVWDDLVTLRNMRWAMGQTMYRTGAGFFDVTLKDRADPEQAKADVDDFIDQGYFDALNNKCYFAHTEHEELDIKGFQGKALNPEQYYLPVIENVSCGTMIPLAILRGAQAGALTGSDINLKEYFKIVSNDQTSCEDETRAVINLIVKIKKIMPVDFSFAWKAPFELTEPEKVDIELKKMQVITAKAGFMTRNECRKLIDPELKDLTPEQGGNDIQGKSTIPAGASAYTVLEHPREDTHK